MNYTKESKKETKSINNPEHTCFNCLKETKVNLHTIEIAQTGYGSKFDGLTTKIQLCNKCYKLTNPEWWKLEQIPIKELNKLENDFYEYKYENEIFEFIKHLPIAGQELFLNHFASGAGADYMEAQDWINGELKYECVGSISINWRSYFI
ncbi:MAG: hypothetical protein PHO80_05220 [Candidatus Gracilibacteria bacterium]|nr:hypothetical protein [Candidatus Gracilibacteria bacterium]